MIEFRRSSISETGPR